MLVIRRNIYNFYTGDNRKTKILTFFCFFLNNFSNWAKDFHILFEVKYVCDTNFSHWWGTILGKTYFVQIFDEFIRSQTRTFSIFKNKFHYYSVQVHCSIFLLFIIIEIAPIWFQSDVFIFCFYFHINTDTQMATKWCIIKMIRRFSEHKFSKQLLYID